MIKYNNEIVYILNIIDSVFREADTHAITENPDFKIDEISDASYLRIRLIKENSIFVLMNIDSCGFTVYIDRANEIISLSLEQINADSNILKDWIRILFFSRIEVEYYGDHHTYISFFNRSKEKIKQLIYNEGILGLLPIKYGMRKVYRYEPIIDMK